MVRPLDFLRPPKMGRIRRKNKRKQAKKDRKKNKKKKSKKACLFISSGLLKELKGKIDADKDDM